MVTQYTWNLKDYDATEVYNASMKYIAGSEELGEALRIFSNHNSTRGSEGEGTEEKPFLIKNASDLTTYESDFISLIEYVKDKAPNARILVIGDFWNKDNRNYTKPEGSAETTGIRNVLHATGE